MDDMMNKPADDGDTRRDPIEVSNPKKEMERGNPAFEEKPDLGDEARSAEITEANEQLQIAHGDDPAPESKETRLDDLSGPEHSIDEHMPADGESAEDKVIDIINSGILRI